MPVPRAVAVLALLQKRQRGIVVAAFGVQRSQIHPAFIFGLGPVAGDAARPVNRVRCNHFLKPAVRQSAAQLNKALQHRLRPTFGSEGKVLHRLEPLSRHARLLPGPIGLPVVAMWVQRKLDDQRSAALAFGRRFNPVAGVTSHEKLVDEDQRDAVIEKYRGVVA